MAKQLVDYVYKQMTIEDLYTMRPQIDQWSEKDCALWLWATSPKLDLAMELMKRWGFEYKTSMVWNKVRPYLGYYVNPIHEFLLIGGRGKSTPTISHKARNAIHSVQTMQFKDIIDTLYPDYQKLELFARHPEPRPNWTFWGDEAAIITNKK
jgi:N6-adenosine-specific RNA methylase IME4